MKLPQGRSRVEFGARLALFSHSTELVITAGEIYSLRSFDGT